MEGRHGTHKAVQSPFVMRNKTTGEYAVPSLTKTPGETYVTLEGMMSARYQRMYGILGRGLKRARPGPCGELSAATYLGTSTAKPMGTRAIAILRPKSLSQKEGWDSYTRPVSNVKIPPILSVQYRLQHSGVSDGDRSTGHSKITEGKMNPSQDRKEAEIPKPAMEEIDLDNVDTKNMTTLQYLRYIRDRVRQLWKRYGMVAFGTYWALYIGGFGGIYALLATGVVDPGVDTSHVLQQLSEWTGAESNATLSGYVKRLQHLVETNPQAERVVVALVANEIIELPREVLVFFVTPSVARALGRAPPRKVNKADD